MDQEEHHAPAMKCACSFSAEQVADALIAKLSDEKTAEKIMNVWGGRIDMQLGRGLRRMALYIFVLVMGYGALKLGLIERLLSK